MPITIYYIYEKRGKWFNDSKNFSDCVKALRFMHKFKNKFFNFEWSCDDPEDNEYLWNHWKNQKGVKMISPNSKRIAITINKQLDDAINDFLDNAGPQIGINTKSQLFTMSVLELFSKLEESIQRHIDSKKGV